MKNPNNLDITRVCPKCNSIHPYVWDKETLELLWINKNCPEYNYDNDY